MVVNEHTMQWVLKGEDSARFQNPMPVDLIEREDISAAVAFLVSDEGRYITGIALPADAGLINKV